jgi:hypothetical protein
VTSYTQHSNSRGYFSLLSIHVNNRFGSHFYRFKNSHVKFERMPPSRCVVQGCSNSSRPKSGISVHLSPENKSQRDQWVRFVRAHRANFNPQGKFGVCSYHFEIQCFQKVFIQGFTSRRRILEGSIPTVWKKSVRESSISDRSHRKVSVTFKL